MSRTASVTTRRALMKGVAWAAPVAAVATTAPALAASPLPIEAVLDAGKSCKLPRTKQYRLSFTFVNTGAKVTVKLRSITVSPNSNTHVSFPLDSSNDTFEIAAGGTHSVDYVSHVSGNAADGQASATFTLEDGSGEREVTQNFGFQSFSNCKD
ncbi:hypothetical protein [Brachybacterium paraconglomeratum]|uniref:hypothetical protein n=1 Tax=Brachybacterium paraconglomeratum TaxID=173362 RepID=UPI0022DF8BCD|nr:hypothetical protein [Brachybacterium paraconglomeratum]